jgi:hypothetical protein
VIALAALDCAAQPVRDAAPAIQDYAMRERIERIEIGQTAEQAHAILGRDPVQRPGHPAKPFPSPLRTLTLDSRAGESLSIELYVVAARAAEGCPDVHVEDVPVVFRNGVVAARSWEVVEASWRGWGGSLEALRSARDTLQCDAPLGAGAPQ